MLAITLVRGALKLVTLALVFFLVVGFAGQFPELRRYPWIFDTWSTLRPLGRMVATQIPASYGRVDFSMLELMVAVVILYLIGEGILNRVEDARRGRVLRSRISEGTQRRLAAAAAGSSTAGAPAPAGSVGPVDGARVYRSEALVVLDVVNSTGLVTRFGNALLASLKERLERVVMPICQRHAATYTKGTGDGYLVTFASTAQGMGALREVFAALTTMNEGLPDGAELALRASMNFGEVIVERDSDRTGGAVHKTFRLQSVGAGELIEADGGIKRDAFPAKNYIVVSEEAASGLKRVPGIQCQFLGLCELKGFPGLHRVYQLHWGEA